MAACLFRAEIPVRVGGYDMTAAGYYATGIGSGTGDPASVPYGGGGQEQVSTVLMPKAMRVVQRKGAYPFRFKRDGSGREMR